MSYVSILSLLYLCNDDFQSDVNNVRKRLGFPLDVSPDTFSEIQLLNHEKKLFSSENYAKKYDIAIRTITNRYNLRSLENDIQIFIETGFTKAPYYKYDIEHVYEFIKWPERKLQVEELNERFLSYSLIFKTKLTANDLNKVIEKIKPKILTQAKAFYGNFEDEYIYVPTFEKIKKIFELKAQGKQYSEIADIICNEFVDDQEVIDGKVNEGSIKSKYHFYKDKYGKCKT